MKKKILLVSLAVALVAVMLVGTVIAYLTDTAESSSTYTVGDVDISLADTGSVNVSNILPGSTMGRIVTVKNESDTTDAYVAIAIKHQSYYDFNSNIDGYYEPKIAAGNYDKTMQDITDAIYNGSGWNGLSYDKTTNGFGIRYYPASAVRDDQTGSKAYSSGDGVKLIAVDYAVANGNNPSGKYGSIHGANPYQGNMLTVAEAYATLGKGCSAGNYVPRLWVYYLYLPAATSYSLDLSVTCPTFIDSNSIAAFKDMTIDVRASAIQVTGFDSAKKAFIELDKTYDFGF